MTIKKVKEPMKSIAVQENTKDRFDMLVKKINMENRMAYGERAKKITQDDVLNELVTAYQKVGEQ